MLDHYGDDFDHYGDDFDHYGDDFDHYGDDFDRSLLETHLELFPISINISEDNDQLSLLDIKLCISSLSPVMMSSMSEVCKLLSILIVMPCTNGVSERSASALHSVKTYNNGSITTDHLIILHIHKVPRELLD